MTQRSGAAAQALRKHLDTGALAYGMQCFTASPIMIEAMGTAGMHFTTIDMEHCPAGLQEVAHGIRAAENVRVTPFVRVPHLEPSTITRDRLAAHYGDVLGDGCWAEYQHKVFTMAQTDALNARLATDWDAIRTRIARVTMAPDTLVKVLEAAGAATLAGDLHIPADLFADAVRHGRELRNRYTFLDLLPT